MAAVAFDPLEYARALESSGVPREQAEVHAKAMTQVFVHNMDALVTTDYLDTRFTEFETRIESKMERRFAEVDARFAEMEAKIERRFAEVDARFISVDARFDQMDAKMNAGFAEVYARMDVRFARTNVLLGVILVAVAVPVLQAFFAWAA